MPHHTENPIHDSTPITVEAFLYLSDSRIYAAEGNLPLLSRQVLGEGPDCMRQWLYILDSQMMRRAELQTNHHLEVSWIRWWAESAGQAWRTQTYSVCSIAWTTFLKKELWPVFVNCLVHVQILPELGLQCNKSDLFLVGVGLCQVVCHGEELEEAAEDQQVWVSLLRLLPPWPTPG